MSNSSRESIRVESQELQLFTRVRSSIRKRVSVLSGEAMLFQHDGNGSFSGGAEYRQPLLSNINNLHLPTLFAALCNPLKRKSQVIKRSLPPIRFAQVSNPRSEPQD
ncbi:hypothetical protein CEXT_302091 [Caerostris extrusa]|uniref:Uncharacterized protein n=1 Tax=Caerostris extrusa TaxID=172846 RepID=A0AAV4VGP3_CAEEX|nr:hypothetical protein CEXT_302091 [Caerostris extrusa]